MNITEGEHVFLVVQDFRVANSSNSSYDSSFHFLSSNNESDDPIICKAYRSVIQLVMSDLDESTMLNIHSLREEWRARAQSSYNYTAQFRPLVGTGTVKLNNII